MIPTGTAASLQGIPKSFPLDFRLEPGRVVRWIARKCGYDPCAMPQPFRDAIRTGLKETAFADIRGGYRVSGDIRIHPEDETVFIDEVPFRVGRQLVNRWKQAEGLALVLCTAGEESGRRAERHLARGDVLAWYVSGLTGTLLASAAMDELLGRLATDAAFGGCHVAGCGFPGNGGWALADQPRLFRLFPEDFCGVGITGVGMLSPVTSLCGVAGLVRLRGARQTSHSHDEKLTWSR